MMKLKSVQWVIMTLALSGLWSLELEASPSSMEGARPMPAPTSHHVGVGWPSISYQWWNAGEPDWALGGELVYGDWAGEFSDLKIGFAFNAPLRWILNSAPDMSVALKLTPGAVIGSVGAGPNDRFVFGVRGEASVPITIKVHDQVNLLTGGTVPFSLFFVEDIDAFAVLPFLVRIGAEFLAKPTMQPFLLLELGPALTFGAGSDTKFAFRAWAGLSFF